MAYFAQLHKSGELSDEELGNVAGGGCSTSAGYTGVTSGLECFITDPDGTPGYTSNFKRGGLGIAALGGGITGGSGRIGVGGSTVTAAGHEANHKGGDHQQKSEDSEK